MRIEIEFTFSGLNHAAHYACYDDLFGAMVWVAQFRIRPLFVRLSIKQPRIT